MDISDFKKHVIPQIEAGKMVGVVRQAIKSEKYTDQDKREALKETFKPITDKLEEEIGELTDEIKDLNTVFVPQAAIEAPPQAAIEGSREKTKMVNADRGLTPEALEVIKSYGLRKPSELSETEDPELVERAKKETARVLKSLGGRKGSLLRRKRKMFGDFEEMREINEKMNYLRAYSTRIEGFPEGFKLSKYQVVGYTISQSVMCIRSVKMESMEDSSSIFRSCLAICS